MVEGRSLYASFYEDIIGVGKEIVEVRIQHLEKKYMFSRYVNNLNELLVVFKRFNQYPYNVYYGINRRKVAGRKDSDIEYRRIFYFDIERNGEKPIIEGEYEKELISTVEYICNKMENKYNLKPCALVKSGRGMHLYYKHEELKREDYDQKFKTWWKNIIEDLSENNPISSIKFDDSVFNIGRIASAPGTNHNKYPEKPFRKILKYAPENINNLKIILDSIILPKYKPIVSVKISKKKLLLEPVFKILKLGVPMNEGRYVNNILMFSASLLCRDAGLNKEEIEEINNKLVEWGYWKGIIMPGSEYNYNPKTINNWCCKNIDWCISKNFKLPYKFLIVPFSFEINIEEKEFLDRELDNIYEVLKYCSEFNEKYCYMNRRVWVFYKESLLKKLQKNCSEEVKKFLDLNNLWNLVCVYRENKIVINM